MDWDHVVELVKALAWPVTTLIAVSYFRRELTAALRRIETAKLPGSVELGFGKARIDKIGQQHSSSRPSSQPIGIDRSKIANIYWLGFDLVWTADVLLRNAPSAFVLRGLRHALHHLSEISSSESPEKDHLAALVREAAALSEHQWSIEVRDRIAAELGNVANAIGSQLEHLQPGFLSEPEANAGVG
jgi:hypothetical protein